MADRHLSHRTHSDTRNARSRSPPGYSSRSHRERSPQRRHHKRKHSQEAAIPPKELPFNSRQLTKRDFEAFRPMFALYLDIQKGKVMEDLEDLEVRGRWKSFVGKWNRGELAEGWYDPSTLQKAVSSSASDTNNENQRTKYSERVKLDVSPRADTAEESDSDDSIGPILPGQDGKSRKGRMGPSIPNMQDLELRREMEVEDGLVRRDDIRFERKMDRKEQKAALDELVPRAEAGTRERQLEKKKELGEKMKSFRDKSPGAADVPDNELMGGGDGIDSYKKQKEVFERKKNERELRKEEFLRARQAERDERLMEARMKEEETMTHLRALAKERFG